MNCARCMACVDGAGTTDAITVGMWRKYLEQAQEQGRKWASDKAEALDGNIAAIDWPDAWRREWDGRLEPSGADEQHERFLADEAHHAAVERWCELVDERRRSEDVEDEETTEEAQALRLMAVLQRDLPPGLIIGHDGPRIFLQDERTGEEFTVSSLQQAWTVVDARG